MDEELLPHIKYRISIDFGKVEIALLTLLEHATYLPLPLIFVRK